MLLTEEYIIYFHVLDNAFLCRCQEMSQMNRIAIQIHPCHLNHQTVEIQTVSFVKVMTGYFIAFLMSGCVMAIMIVTMVKTKIIAQVSSNAFVALC